jgi:serine protease Do
VRPADVLALVIFVGSLILHGAGFFEDGTERAFPDGVSVARTDIVERRPPMAKSETRRPLPAPNPGRDPVILVQSSEPEGNTVGTAFSLDSDGVWMTARHVVEGCRRLGLQTPVRATTWIDDARSAEHADLAILIGGLPGPSLAISNRLPDIGESAYGIGYPQGNPGDVSGTLMGRAVSRTRGRMGFEEPVLVWAEQSRFPDFDGGLGGISGGPLLSAEGAVVGVIISGSPRRGRFNTSAPRAIRPVLDAAPITPDEDDRIVVLNEALSGTTFATWGAKLRESEAVARVVCLRD